MSSLSDVSRREILKRASSLFLPSISTPIALNLLSMSNVAAASSSSYKALVCVFLYGGNDHYNTVIPYDSYGYNNYFKVRANGNVIGKYDGLALRRNELLSMVLNSSSGLPSGCQMALAPGMDGMKNLFDSGRASIVLNMGSLVVPTNKNQYLNKSVPLPLKLFSHNDQQAYWHTAGKNDSFASGWGGRTADLILDNNSNSALTCISINGNSTFLAGENAQSYQLTTSGAYTVNSVINKSLFESQVCAEALASIISYQSPNYNVLEYEYVNKMNRALYLYDDVNSALNSTTSALTDLFKTKAVNSLSAQMAMVARMISQHSRLGLKRQVFMVGLGGFDLHDKLAYQHYFLLKNISDAFKEFDDAMNFLNLSDNVTAFTASDFGRTLTYNGDGTDHGWGAHHFICGGSVSGARFLGLSPKIGITHDEQIGNGRLIPTSSIDQVFGELARWFGISDSDIKLVFPNSVNFDMYKLSIFGS